MEKTPFFARFTLEFMELYYSPKFIKSYNKLPQRIKILAEKKEKVFIKEPFNRVLETHKLHGDFAGFWTFSVNRIYRVVFDLLGENTVRFYDIGTHDIYK